MSVAFLTLVLADPTGVNRDIRLREWAKQPRSGYRKGYQPKRDIKRTVGPRLSFCIIGVDLVRGES